MRVRECERVQVSASEGVRVSDGVRVIASY